LPVLTDRLAAEAIQLETAGIFFSSAFTKTLFVRFRSTPVLEKLRSSLGLSVPGYDPHLSLLYPNLPSDAGARLARSINLPFSVVTFDGVRAFRCPNPTTTRAEVESWRLFRSLNLARPGESTDGQEPV
jgi:hypothetical protein